MVSLKMAFKMGERRWLLMSGNGFVGPSLSWAEVLQQGVVCDLQWRMAWLLDAHAVREILFLNPV